MTLDDAIEHGRAWVAAGWTWERGQVAIAEDYDGEWRVMLVTSTADGRPCSYGVAMPATAVPDLRDRGTLGHARGQVRDAWGDPWLYLEAAEADDPGRVECASFWIVVGPTGGVITGDTEAEALLAARRAAP